MTTFREASRLEWTPTQSDGPVAEQISIGCLQRIADATEKMALRYTELIDRNTRLQRDYNRLSEKSAKQERTIAGLRGTITKLKRAQSK